MAECSRMFTLTSVLTSASEPSHDACLRHPSDDCLHRLGHVSRFPILQCGTAPVKCLPLYLGAKQAPDGCQSRCGVPSGSVVGWRVSTNALRTAVPPNNCIG